MKASMKMYSGCLAILKEERIVGLLKVNAKGNVSEALLLSKYGKYAIA